MGSRPLAEFSRNRLRWHAAFPAIALAGTALFFFCVPPHEFPDAGDIRLILVHTVIVGLSALGMCLIMVTGAIDLSVGSAVALVSIAAAKAARGGADPAIVIAAGIGAGVLCGTYNGLLVTGLRLPSFITTLGTLGFFRGLAKWWSDSRQVSVPPDRTGWMNWFVQPSPTPQWLVVAPAVWIMLVLGVLTHACLTRTVIGRQATALGSNEEAARRAGVSLVKTRLSMFMLAGLFVGVAGLMQFARLNQGDPTVQVGLELQVIAAVVIGGGSLSGGHVSVFGAITGAAMMALLNNRCIAVGWPNYIQEIVVGHIIIVAVAADRWRASRA